MPNLQNAKRDISNAYFSTSDTVERYNILNEILDHIDTLRTATVQEIDNGKFDTLQPEDVLCTIQQILSLSSSMHIDSVKAVVHLDSEVSQVFVELNLDSLDYVEFIMEVEEQLDVEISDYDAERFNTISDIINIVIKK